MEQSDNIFKQYKEQMQLQELENESLPFDREQLWDTITSRLEVRPSRATIRFRRSRIAAAVLLLTGSSIFLYQQRSDNTNPETNIAKEQAVFPAVGPQFPAEPPVHTTPLPPKPETVTPPTHKQQQPPHSVAAHRRSRQDLYTTANDLPTTQPDITDSIDRIMAYVDKQPAIATTLEKPIVAFHPGTIVTNPTGQPGATNTIRIRGFSSISGNSTPLYIVDGQIYTKDIANLNTADIETLDILKDATATAQYGSRGSNGVIIITTKSGNDTGIHANGNLWDKLFKRKHKRSSRGR